jgi:hypothetical protein
MVFIDIKLYIKMISYMQVNIKLTSYYCYIYFRDDSS